MTCPIGLYLKDLGQPYFYILSEKNPIYNNITVCLDLPQICPPDWTQSSLLYFILVKHSVSVHLKHQWTMQKKTVMYCTCTDTLPKNQINGSLLTLVDSSSFLRVTKDFLSSAPSVSSWHNCISNTLSLFWAPSAAWLDVSVGTAEVSPCDSVGISALFSLADGHWVSKVLLKWCHINYSLHHS